MIEDTQEQAPEQAAKPSKARKQKGEKLNKDGLVAGASVDAATVARLRNAQIKKQNELIKSGSKKK